MKKSIALLVILGLGYAGWWWFTRPVPTDDDDHQANMPKHITWLDTGLTPADKETWHHLSEGSELVPIAFLEALKHPKTGKPFIDSLSQYGFLRESTNPRHLPIGWTMEVRKVAGYDVPFIGINCAACHTGEIRYKGQAIRIDGAPNMFALEAFFLDLQSAATEMKSHPLDALVFVREVVRRMYDTNHAALINSLNAADDLNADEKQIIAAVNSPFTNPSNVNNYSLEAHPGLDTNAPGLTAAQVERRGALRELVTSFREHEQFIERRLESFSILSKAIQSGVELGPGRGDSFGIIRDLLFPKHEILLDAPVSTPALFDFKNFTWIHWDGNTTSVMDRNIAQAIALGADFDPETGESSVLPKNLYKLDQVGSKLTAPAWPEHILGRIDRAKAGRGAVHYTRLCAECHTREAVYDLKIIGTSPYRATNFTQRIEGAPFVSHLEVIAGKTRTEAYEGAGITEVEGRAMERTNNPTWRATGGYIARPLKGVWATAPYLHNGSVPTLYHLLQPAAQRPVKFKVGPREFDPVQVGYLDDATKPGWILDTTIQGNENTGHEYGAALNEPERLDLVEYLKTL